LSLRLGLIVGFQAFIALFISWEKVVTWWPFAMIASGIVCLFILVRELMREKKPFSSILLEPFETSLSLGRLTQFLKRKFSENRLRSLLADILIFCVLLLLLGLPAIVLNGYLAESIPVLRDAGTIGVLPNWALLLMLFLLPPAQALIEFPWFYGYFYPRFERYFISQNDDRELVASGKALSIVLLFFILQVVFIPLVLDPDYMLWRAVSNLPLLLVVGIVIRLVPRFMPGVNILHALMALNVVIGYWNAK
jgi:hypothetical protein